jgi:uncharacterized protein DUF2844
MGLKAWRPGILLAMMVLSLPAWASLGGDDASVQADQAQMKATLRTTTPSPRFTLFEMQTPSGTSIREYVSPEGLVFAVAWEGPSLPDLQQLLGTYFSKYVEGTSRDGGGGPRVVQLPGLVVFSGGQMRAFVGRAYLPQSIPNGVTLEQIR